MRLADIIQKLGLEVKVLPPKAGSREVTGAYVGDVLSHAVANLGRTDVWITIQTHENVVGVASLTDAVSVIVCQREIPDNTLRVAEEQGISILKSPATAFETAGKIWSLLGRSGGDTGAKSDEHAQVNG